ncbi:MAG: RecQ family ATP-dependent DNA helicase [Bacteroidetes bacterium]|nr:RecQ family ATP-dependent DNA helicase [Bacteroidota bacterium]
MPTSIEILQQYFGYDSFREPQEEIIQSIIEGKDTLALLPTGGGKSLCFQIPALMQDGICIVVTPLIALMRDQVANLKQKNIKAAAVFSGLSYAEIDLILDNAQFGYYKFLYVSPERLKTEIFIERFKNMNVNLIAVDEAHCVSQWGYDFRPPYLEIAEIRKYHPQVPVLALTASATKNVQKDIAEKLAFKTGNRLFQKSFLRSNIKFVARNEQAKYPKMVEIIQKVKGSGIVYVRNRNRTKEIAEYLINNKVSADFYHAGLSNEQRNRKQENWVKNKTQVIVCTNAFGMGIDKPDVRFVIHADIPESLEAYYQEAGRAGRDGEISYTVLLYTQQDIDSLNEKLEEKFPTKTNIRNVYNALCNHLKIPIENGFMLTCNFDIVYFCSQFKLKIQPTFYALKILEQQGYIQLNEGVLLPSRIVFKVDNLELYKFEVAHSEYSLIIKTILRTYGGIIHHYTKISEPLLASKLKMKNEDVVEQLNFLNRQKILSYVPASDKPTVTFLTERLHDDNLHIDTKYFQQRKTVIEAQVYAMIEYIEQEKSCRQAFICAYFGEENAPNCGCCDVCLNKNKAVDLDEDFVHAKRTILEKLADGKWKKLDTIMPENAHFAQQLYKDVARFLLDEKLIEINVHNELRIV